MVHVVTRSRRDKLPHNESGRWVAQLLNKAGGEPFDSADEERFWNFMASMGLILESWWRMSRNERSA